MGLPPRPTHHEVLVHERRPELFGQTGAADRLDRLHRLEKSAGRRWESTGGFDFRAPTTETRRAMRAALVLAAVFAVAGLALLALGGRFLVVADPLPERA